MVGFPKYGHIYRNYCHDTQDVLLSDTAMVVAMVVAILIFFTLCNLTIKPFVY